MRRLLPCARMRDPQTPLQRTNSCFIGKVSKLEGAPFRGLRHLANQQSVRSRCFAVQASGRSISKKA